MDIISIKGGTYRVDIGYSGSSSVIRGGSFGEIAIEECPVFSARLKNVDSGESVEISSKDVWKKVRLTQLGHTVKLNFSDPLDITEIGIDVKAVFDDIGISWYVEVQNDNPVWSVMNVTYPVPLLSGENFDLFVPHGCGFVVKDVGQSNFVYRRKYPGGYVTMQYLAAYGKNDGIYIGIEDGVGANKRFEIMGGDGRADAKITFFGVNASRAGNSFALSGPCRWQYVKGDWYDATLLYADFVKRSADWLPPIEADGRADTPRRFKEVPFWVADYVPNTPSQGDNKPMSLSAGSDRFDKGYWIDAVMELQKELDVPIAYHVYNWHEIPFNIEYPHFLPAKEEFVEGIKKLHERPIYVLPYINAGSWEIHDAEMGHEVNFENTGIHGAAITETGGLVIEKYPQTTLKGETSKLANMCPSSTEWRTVVNDLVREMEKTLPIDGIYFDQIGAIQATPCYNEKHGHPVGGGTHWAEGYRLLMDKVNSGKPKNSFYFTEDTNESYIRCYDGFLSWRWVKDAQVPAFPLVYAGYIEMIGRCMLGKKKEDYDFFKFSLAESLLYGQQLGWYKADVVYDEKRLSFLKKMVRLRYKNTELFHSSTLMRPPKVKSSVSPKITAPALSFKEDVTMEQVLSGAWRYRSREKLTLFCINISEEEAEFSLSFSRNEYGLDEYELPEDFRVDGDVCTVSGKLSAEDYAVWYLKRKAK